MVNVDELNDYIEQFGTVTNKLDTLAGNADVIEKTSQKQEALIEDVKSLFSEQREATELLRTQWTEAQVSINTHIDNTEKHLSDKIQLMEVNLNQIETNLGKAIESNQSQTETKLSQTESKLVQIMESNHTQMETKLSQMEANLVQANEQLTSLINEQISDIKTELKTVKNLQYASIIIAAIVAILVVVMHFI